MRKIGFSLLFLSTVAFAQETRSVGDFNKVTSFDRIDVFLVQSDENKVRLEGNGSEDVELINKNGELKIRMPLTKLLDGDSISVTVYYKKITAVEANEGSRIACGDKIKATDFDIIAKEGAQVKLLLEVDKLTARVANGSSISLDGNAKIQEVTVKSGGTYYAAPFKTEITTISVKAGGDATVYATDLLDVQVLAGGEVTILGEPKQIKEDVIAGGRISKAIKRSK